MSHTPPSDVDQVQRFRFPKTNRLRNKDEFDRVYQRRCKAGDGTLLVFAAENAGGPTRIGLSVSRKVGNAVVRNRVKRLLREAFRLSQHALPVGLDLVVIPTAPDKAALDVYRRSLTRLTAKLRRRLDEQRPTTDAAAPALPPASPPESSS